MLGQLLSPAEGRARAFSLSCFSRCPRVQEGSASVPVRLKQPPAPQAPAPRLLLPQPLCSSHLPAMAPFPAGCQSPLTSGLWLAAPGLWCWVPMCRRDTLTLCLWVTGQCLLSHPDLRAPCHLSPGLWGSQSSYFSLASGRGSICMCPMVEFLLAASSP